MQHPPQLMHKFVNQFFVHTKPLSLRRVSQNHCVSQSNMHIAFVIPSSYYCKQQCVSVAEMLRCCVKLSSYWHHTFVMSNTSLVRTLVPSTCYHPSSCLTTSWEWHESAHQYVRPEHVCDRNSQTQTGLNLGGNATPSTTLAQICQSVLLTHEATQPTARVTKPLDLKF